MKKSKQVKVPQIIGWKEVIGLPELGIPSLKVKVDTGARSSALHANIIDVRDVHGVSMVEFDLLNPDEKPESRHIIPVFGILAVKNTSGIVQDRYAIKTVMAMGGKQWPIHVTLADRTTMKYDMILGRMALRNRNLLINPRRSYLAGDPS